MGKEKSATILSLLFVEKISGLILTIIGAILAYYAYMDIKALGALGGFSVIAGAALVILGLLMIAAKSE